MKIIKLENEELINIKGGSASAVTIGTVALLVVTGITFVIGVIDGIVRPLACNK